MSDCRPRNPMYYANDCAEHIGSPLTDDGRCQEARMVAAEAQVQAVREVANKETVYPGGYADGWHSAMQHVLHALDGDGDE